MVSSLTADLNSLQDSFIEDVKEVYKMLSMEKVRIVQSTFTKCGKRNSLNKLQIANKGVMFQKIDMQNLLSMKKDKLLADRGKEVEMFFNTSGSKATALKAEDWKTLLNLVSLIHHAIVKEGSSTLRFEYILNMLYKIDELPINLWKHQEELRFLRKQETLGDGFNVSESPFTFSLISAIFNAGVHFIVRKHIARLWDVSSRLKPLRNLNAKETDNFDYRMLDNAVESLTIGSSKLKLRYDQHMLAMWLFDSNPLKIIQRQLVLVKRC
ncbi:unnamed protein product [Ambrosiozyma monospora]|uniref:Unnamed protein product n=1 Tax=Ambrosiozyma monospora TaxID=43982 RepID=A0ACB5SRG9_AMBMO|nr:unnamed protein product [Ambrosiozyma monospora]